MIIFAILFVIFANILNHSKGVHSDVKTAALLVAYLWLILIFSFRGSDIPDTKAYMKLYYGDITASNLEYLFSAMCTAAKSLGLSFHGFLIVFQLLLFSLWFLATRKIFTDVHFAFMVFLPFMGIYNFGIIIRAGMGICICYYALAYLLDNRDFKHYIFYYLIVTVAVFFHQSMAVFYILPLYIFRKFNPLILLSILLLSILVPVFNIQHLIANFLESYITLLSFKKFLSYTTVHARFNLHGVYSLTMIKYAIMALIFIALRPKIIAKQEIYNYFLNIYVSGVLLIGLTYFILAGNRLSYIFFFFEFALVAMLYEYSSLPRKLVLLGAIMLCFLNFANLVSAVPGILSF
jgi:hypothetical protein